MKARIWQENVKRKTYKVGEGSKAPHFIEKKQYQGACGKVYPLQVADRIFDETEEKEYDMIRLENDYISVNLLPAIGGKIYGAKAKKNGYEFIYENPVVKPALIGLCGPWVSGGAEFNWPQHHRPTTYSPVEYKLRENPDGSVTCFMGELEPLKHMRGMVAVTVYPDSTLVEAKGIVTNCTDKALPFMWWNNTAVRVHSQYKAIFPPDIEYGSDHDRRAIISFPVMKGIFKTARPYDYGDGTDVTWFSEVKVPTSLMIPRGETKMDFLGGYDYKREAGTMIIHDHHTSPGCKMFTWGDADFGRKWCSNLTDNDDRYLELMTGSYTDNQPDFAYIEPGETKEFINCWYPIQGIGNVSNAGMDGAILLEKADRAGSWKVGAVVTRRRPGLRLVLESKGKILFERRGELDPESFWLDEVEVPGEISEEMMTLSLYDGEGELLLLYTPTVKGKKQPPRPRERAPYPKDVYSVEMLYIYGRHLAQYKHGTYQPEDYFLEALRRSPKDYRCNLEMGKIMLERGDFEQAQQYLQTAMERITFENTSPQDSEIYYQMGRLLRLKGELEEAYGYFRAAAWQYPYRSSGYFESACISCTTGHKERAAEELREALKTNAMFYAARTLLAYLTGDVKAVKKIIEEFPLDGSARYTLWLMTGETVGEFVRTHPEYVLDAALLFEKAGLKGEAVRILRDCDNPSMNLLFHLQALTGESAGEASLTQWLPNRLEDIAVLTGGDWRASYILGCLYYDRENYTAARDAWEKSMRANDRYGYTWRNLAIAYYDHLGKPELAHLYMTRAVDLEPGDARLVYELMQIEKEDHISIEKRIETTRTYRDQVYSRDDAWLDAAILRMQTGDYAEAKEMLLEKSFHIYEGGEGKLTKYHRWLHVLMANQAMSGGDYETAEKELDEALNYPLSYGEGRGFLEQDANVHYLKGLLMEITGRPQEAEACYKMAEEEPELVNEILYFTGLCEERVGHKEAALRHYHMLLEEGETYAHHPDRYGYFGVGMESPLPFESNIRKNNMVKAHTLRMLAYLGLREMAACDGEKLKLKALDPDNPLLIFLGSLGIL